MQKQILTLLVVLLATTFGFSQESRSLPNVKVKTLAGDAFNISELDNNNKPMVISFWATWCKPCKKELNNISEVYEDWQEETGVKLVAISIDDTRSMSKVAPFVNASDWEYEVYLDPNGDLKSMRELKTVMKEDGILFLAVPVGLDRIVFNLHRIYGKARLPLLLENWKFIGFAGFWFGMVDQDFGHGVQPVLVLENTNDSKYTNEYYEQLIYFTNKFIEELPTPYQTE